MSIYFNEIVINKTLKEHGGELSELTIKMSKLGKSGKYPNNIERDLSNLLRLPLDPFYVTIPVRDPECRSKVTSMVVPMLLPHQLFHFLHVACLLFLNWIFQRVGFKFQQKDTMVLYIKLLTR